MHFEEQVRSLTGALTNTGEHRHTTVLGGHSGNHFLDEHGLSNTGTTEETNLSTLHIRSEQVNDLDARLEHGGAWLELVEVWSRTVNVPTLFNALNNRHVEWLAEHVEHVTKHCVADRHRDATTGVANGSSAEESIGWLHADATNASLANLLGDFCGDGYLLAIKLDVHLNRAIDFWQCVWWKLGVNHRSGDCDDSALLEGGCVVCGHGHLLMLPSLGGALQRRPRFP